MPRELTAKDKGHVRMLMRRRDRLHVLVKDWQGREGGDSWARAECAAISWALEMIGEHLGVDIEAEMQNEAKR